MTTIDPRRYRATTQCVAEAIARSISHTDIVTIEPHCPDVLAELLRECEGDVSANGYHETWGTDMDGCEWRVHVEGL